MYGPIQADRKDSFLQELREKILSLNHPFIIDGDFNLIRYAWEKSSDNLDQCWMDAFNDFINDTGVRELLRKGGKYTWSNKQLNPVMCVLDRVFVSSDWDEKFPVTTYVSLVRVGSDHCPIIVDTEDRRVNILTCLGLRRLG